MIKFINIFLLFVLAQIIAWFQIYGQYKWPWFSNNYWFLLLLSIPITYFSLEGTKIGMDFFNNETWPLRFLGFAIGMIIFTILSNLVLKEALTSKTIATLLLCIAIMLIQAFWK